MEVSMATRQLGRRGGVALSVSTKVIETVRPSRELKGGTASPESSRDYKT